MKNFIHEIHRRSLWQVLGIYLAVSWIVLQVVDVIGNNFGLPDWVAPVALVLLLIGLPVVIGTAFIQEGMTAKAPEAPPSAAADDGGVVPSAPEPVTGAASVLTWRNALIGGVISFAVLGLVGTAWVVFGGARIGATASMADGDDASTKAVAVLPFTSVGEENEAFRVGIHDALLAQLAKVGELRVISRTSTLEYDGTTKNMRQIGEELGVANLVEGSVQRAEDMVQINVQLINAATDEHRWSESYVRDLSAANLISVQGEIVRDITRALEAALAPEEALRIAEVPTENLEAYDLFLMARDHQQRGGNDGRTETLPLLERAVELDPEFALAWAYLSIAHSDYYWFGQDRTQERTEQARQAVDQAFEFRPDLAEAHMALGEYYYRVHRDYESALTELAVARQGLGDTPELLTTLASVYRRQGDAARAADVYRRASELDPRSLQIDGNLGQTLWLTGEFAEAERIFDRLIARAPTFAGAWTNKARTRFFVSGDVADQIAVLEQAREAGVEYGPFGEWNIFMATNRPAEALAALEAAPDFIPQQYGNIPKAFFAAASLTQLGDTAHAQAAYDSARIVLEQIVRDRPENETARVNLAFVYANLGRREDAVRTAAHALELMPRDAFIGPGFTRSVAAIYTTAGELDLALDQLEAIPEFAWWGNNFETDPLWEPLRDNPRFASLVERDRAKRATLRTTP